MAVSHSSVGTNEGCIVTMETPENQQLKVTMMSQVYYPPGFLQKVVAEMVATFLLVFVTCGCVAVGSSNEHMVSQLGVSLAGGLIVTVMIYAVGHISGAHMNPAVTIAFATVRHFPWNQVPTQSLNALSYG
ncbi:hypothetical protein L1987_68295 [Smallanthus sonchifolius]|uniref:Uncharacterized protein n=1 Tax=Smallanthus sonchifolius TaxID=185202 RepID=A0ACB9B3L5_9ASTR|nr:hypothetical protein L1987_68295 [Smallanthus sonchifolius]